MKETCKNLDNHHKIIQEKKKKKLKTNLYKRQFPEIYTHFTSAAITGTDNWGPLVKRSRIIWNPSICPNLFTRSTNQP